MDWTSTAARLTAERCAAMVHSEMARGLDGLATVAATAPFLGLLATVFGIIGSFRGCGGNRASCMGALAGYLSGSLAPMAFGLAVAIIASAGHRHLRARVADFDTEMHHAVTRIWR